MKVLSEATIERLKAHVLGDVRMTTVRNVQKLGALFTAHGGEALAENILPRAAVYAADQLRRINGTEHLRRLIEDVFDPVNCHGHARPAVRDFNKFFQRDGYKVVLTPDGSKVQSLDGADVSLVVPADFRADPAHFVEEQVVKCGAKLRGGDYAGAITNARTLCEEVFWYIERQFDPTADRAGGDLLRLFSRVRKRLNIDAEKFKGREDVLHVISGLVSVVNGLSAMSNAQADRHARNVQPKPHHARLAVNAANTVCTFVVASYVDQLTGSNRAPSVNPASRR